MDFCKISWFQQSWKLWLCRKSLGMKLSEKTIQNCFRKAKISMESQESAIYENDDPFKPLDPIIYFVFFANFPTKIKL